MSCKGNKISPDLSYCQISPLDNKNNKIVPNGQSIKVKIKTASAAKRITNKTRSTKITHVFITTPISIAMGTKSFLYSFFQGLK